jgi:hypothetical protein
LLWLQLDDVTVKFQAPRIGFESSYSQPHCQHHSRVWIMGYHMKTTAADPEKLKLDICGVAA